MSRINVDAFWEWFDKARGDLTIRDVEKRAGVPRGRIGNPASEKRRPTADVCRAIADGIPAPFDVVMKQAGYGDDEALAADVTIQDVIEYMKRIPPEERALVRNFAEWRYQLSFSTNRGTNAG